MTAEIFEFKKYRSRKAAEQELLSYLAWTLKHEFDPHKVYADPIEVFRAELNNKAPATACGSDKVSVVA